MLVRSTARRLLVDLQREIVIALCGLIIAGLFAYVFGDFVEGHIARISVTGRDRIATVIAVILTTIAPCFIAVRSRRKLYEPGGLATVLHRIGEEKRVVRQMASIWQIITAFSTAALMIFVVKEFFPSVGTAIFATNFLALCIALVGLILTSSPAIRSDQKSGTQLRIWNDSPGSSKTRSMLSWRVFQIIRRNPLIRWCAALSMFALIGVALSSLSGSHPIVALGFGLLAGLGWSMIFPLQLQEDLRNSWTEKNAGVSHQDLIRNYNIMTQTSGAALTLLIFLLGFMWQSTDWMIWLQVGLASASFCLITPGMLFQIDARRPLLQIAIILLFGIFIATGIYVHLAAVVLIPLLNYYTVQYQNGRYYRA